MAEKGLSSTQCDEFNSDATANAVWYQPPEPNGEQAEQQNEENNKKKFRKPTGAMILLCRPIILHIMTNLRKYLPCLKAYGRDSLVRLAWGSTE